MPRLPQQPNFDHLKKQAKDLLRLYDKQDPAALERFRKSLPTAADKDDTAIVALHLKLHDAQSCIAREYGLSTWTDLKDYVDWRNSRFSKSRDATVPLWLHGVYGHDHDRPQPELAARVLAEHLQQGGDFVQGDMLIACALGDESTIRHAIADDRKAVNRIDKKWRCPGCKKWLDLPPLVAVTHSSLLRIPEFRDRLLTCARLLLDAGADPKQAAGDPPLSALYGAAGKNHDPELIRMLLDAGANPNDGESLYHSTETRDLTCTRLLLEAGATVENSNALHHQLDSDNLEGLRLLLAYTKNVNDPASSIGNPLLWAIRRGRSRAHVELLLQAGADPHAADKDGIRAYQLAMQSGLIEVADALQQAGAALPLTTEEQFVAACARCDEPAARHILAAHPGIFSQLSEAQLKQLPNLTEAHNKSAVRLMVELGWPIKTRGGDWDASAVNLAVFQGDAELTRFLLDHGASWMETHGHRDNVHGTLSWASRNHDADQGDWVGCARALVDHGMPVLDLDGEYSEEVEEFMAEERAKLSA